MKKLKERYNKITENKWKSQSMSEFGDRKDSNFVQKNNIIKEQKGITLIALVITIILIIILAGISINLILGDNGVISRAKTQQEEQDIARILEKLELEKDTVGIDNGYIVKLDKYLEYAEGMKLINPKDIIDNDGQNALVLMEDKYVYLLEEEDNGNLKITYNGKIESLSPKIEIKSITNTTNTIKVEVSTKRNEDGIIEYYYKKDGETEYILAKSTQDTTYTYQNLEQNKKYNIKIVAINKRDKKAEVEVNRITGEVVELTQANTTFEYSPSGWTNHDVTVTVSTTVTGYSLQTSKDGKTWESIISQTFTENGVIYARLVDNTNQAANGYAAGNVDKIDKTKPEVISATATTNTISIKAKDEESGIIGYAVTTLNTEPTNFTSCTNTKFLNVNVEGFTQETSYYVWVKDLAGNVSLSKQVETTSVTGLTQANTTFTYNPNSWTNGTVTATVSTTVTGYSIQTSKDGKTWETTASQIFTENGAIYARLIDNTNQASNIYATGNVDKIDKIKPIITEAIASTNTISVKATDEASGIIGYAVTQTNTEPTSFTDCSNTKSLNTEANGFTQGTTYYVWVKDEAGNISTGKEIGTGTVIGLVDANTTFTYNPTGWTNQNVTATVSTTVEGFILQTSKDGRTWESTASQTFTENGAIYARLVDTTNQANGYAAGNVDKIDKTKPQITEATASTNKILIKATDEASGIIGYAVTQTNTEPTSFTDCSNTKSLKTEANGFTQGTTYYVWVKDLAGNISTSKQVGTQIVTSAEGKIKINAEEWNKTTHLASVSFYKDETKYPEIKDLNIEYKVEGKTDWTSGETASSLNHKDIISLRLSDGANKGASTTYTVSEHVWDAGVVTTPSTCTATGIKTYTCTTCEDTKQETVERIAHDINGGQGTTITPATCIATGTAYYKCSKCGQDNTSTSQRMTLPKNSENHVSQITRTATQKIDLYASKDMDPSTFNGYCNPGLGNGACGKYAIFHFYLRNKDTNILIPGTNTILQTFQKDELGGACGYYYCTNCGNVYCEYVDYKIYFNRSGNASNISQVTGGWSKVGKVWELGSSYDSTQITIYSHWVNWIFDYTYCSACGQYEYSNGHYEHV